MKPSALIGLGKKFSTSVEQRKKRTRRIVRKLHRLYADADCALGHDSALQLLVATILSAQCTDERVNQVTPALFRRYRTAGPSFTASVEINTVNGNPACLSRGQASS